MLPRFQWFLSWREVEFCQGLSESIEMWYLSLNPFFVIYYIVDLHKMNFPWISIMTLSTFLWSFYAIWSLQSFLLFPHRSPQGPSSVWLWVSASVWIRCWMGPLRSQPYEDPVCKCIINSVSDWLILVTVIWRKLLVLAILLLLTSEEKHLCFYLGQNEDTGKLL